MSRAMLYSLGIHAGTLHEELNGSSACCDLAEFPCVSWRMQNRNGITKRPFGNESQARACTGANDHPAKSHSSLIASG